jgi:NitT/TauT family transport system permease protein
MRGRSIRGRLRAFRARFYGTIVSEYFASSTSGSEFGIKDNLRKAEMATGWAYTMVASVVAIVSYLVIVLTVRRVIRWHASQRYRYDF